MTQILPWGKLFPIDAAGFIVNDCHHDKILPPWTRLVAELRETCMQLWSNRLGGLYLRGSVPRGLAIPQVSDLDSFAILDGEITATDINLAQNISTNLKKRYLFCHKIELILLNLTGIYQTHSVWPAILQTKSLPIFEKDSFSFLELPKVKPGVSLINYAYTWETDLCQTLDDLAILSPNDLNYAGFVRKKCGWITRRMIRTGFELVMEQDQSYTPDLYYCYHRFSAYFSWQQAAMKKALELAIAPSANRAGLMIFLRRFGGWLVTQVNSQVYPAVGGDDSTDNMP
jgi:hypothetical protein